MARKTTQAEVRDSILDMRRIYPELSDQQFAKRYNRLYRVPVESVLQVIQDKKSQ